MRYHAPDSLRGAAADIVVIYHCRLVMPFLEAPLFDQGTSVYATPDLWTGIITLVPFRILWAGREAVIFFFVLSGFVLTLPCIGERPPRYVSFIVMRFFRLHIPFATMILIAAGVWLAVAPEAQAHLSHWFNRSWSEEPVLSVIPRHLSMTGDMSLNNVSWTLVIEWRVALLFPLLVLMSRISPLATVIGSLALVIIYMASANMPTIKIPSTLYYFIYFVIGIMVALYLQPILDLLSKVGRAGMVTLWFSFYVLFNLRWLTPLDPPLTDLGNGIAAALIIGLVLTSPRAQSFLTTRPHQWLGTVTYSLYLVHVPLLMAVIHLLPATVPVYLALMAVPPASLLIAHLFHNLVEHPSMHAGRTAGRWIDDIIGLRSTTSGKGY